MKMFRFIFSLTLLFVNPLFSQDTIKVTDEPVYRSGHSLFIGGFVSPDLSYSIIPRDNSGIPSIKNYQASYDIPKFSVTVGLEGMYQINRRLSLTLGIQYSGKGGKTEEFEYEPLVDTDPVSMYYVYDYRYIDIPLRLDVYLARGKVSPFITAGVSTNVFINQRTSVFGIDQNNQAMENSYSSRSGFSAITPQLQAGVGIDIALKYSRLRIFPVYRLNLTDTRLRETYAYSDATVKAQLYSIGLGVNCFFGL